MNNTAAIQRADPDQLSGPSPFDEQRRVLVSGGAIDPALIGILQRLNFSVEWVHAPSFDPSEISNDVTALIVSDTEDGALDLCAALSPICPVILLSNRPTFGLRLAAAEAGVSALVHRPVIQSELSEWLEHFASTHTEEPISVLVVDDDWLTTELCAEVLRASGIAVHTVNDPQLALHAIEDSRPDIILMDVQMPVADGIKLAQIIRQSRQYSSLPIIFLSAERDESRQFAARQFGGDDFISKSISPEKLVSLVKLRAERSKLMRSLIERDGLTGLYDHCRFTERLWQELERCRRSGAECSLVMIDIDHFKRINDTHGHPTGDEVIRTLASSLTLTLRRIDIVGRCGGEEFGVILLDTGPETAKLVVDKLRERFATIAFGDDSSFSVTFSAGVASSRDHAGLIDLVAAADRALYEAKRAGRNRIEISTPHRPTPTAYVPTPATLNQSEAC